MPRHSQGLDILREMELLRQPGSEFVFPGAKPGKPMSGMALEMLLRRMNVDATPHGFRSSFRDWCGERTQAPREVAEAALGHRVGNAAELAYRRGDALTKRRELMTQWATYCSGDDTGGVVVPLRLADG